MEACLPQQRERLIQSPKTGSNCTDCFDKSVWSEDEKKVALILALGENGLLKQGILKRNESNSLAP